MNAKAKAFPWGKKNVTFSFLVAMVAALYVTSAAPGAVVVFDDFERADEPLDGSTPTQGVGTTWSAHANTAISGNRVFSSSGGGGGYIPISLPTDGTLAIQARMKRHGQPLPHSNHSLAIGFTDDSAANPIGSCTGTGCWSGLHMAVNVGGTVKFWQNDFAEFLTGQIPTTSPPLPDLTDNGIDDDFFDVRLEIDQDSNRARGYVGDLSTPLIDIAYTRTDTITGAGFSNSSTNAAEWDDFSVTYEPIGPVFMRSWRLDQSGDWNSAGNWDPFGIPNDTETTVAFGDHITSNRVVFTETDVFANRIQFTATPSYVVSGSGAINLGADSLLNDPAVDAFLGSHEFQAPVKLLANTTVTTGTNTNLTFNNTLSLGGHTLTKAGSGSMAIRNTLATGGGLIDIQGGTVTGNGTVGGDVNNTGGTILPGDSAAVGNLSVPEPGTLILLALGLLVSLFGIPWHRR